MPKSFKNYETKIYTSPHLKIYSNPQKMDKVVIILAGINFSLFLGIAMDSI